MTIVVGRAAINALHQYRERQLAAEGGRTVLEELVAYYLSPYWPDRSIERFVAICGEFVAERDRLRAALVAAGATGT